MKWDDRIGRRLKLRDLHILLAVMELGSMGKAATRLAMSQPAVSKAIADLEYALGVRVLDRSRQGIEPTVYGRALLKCGSAVFDDLRRGVQEIGFLSDPTAGEVRIGTSEFAGAGIVSAVIEQLSRQHPRLVFEVAIADSASLYRQLAERSFELGIGRMLGRSTEENVSAEILYDESLVVVAGNQSKWASRRKIRLAELISERWIMSPADTVVTSLLQDACRANNLEPPRPAVVTLSLHMRNTLLATGHFLTVLPASMLRFSTNRLFRALPVELGAPQRPVAILTLKNRTLSPVAQLFVEAARTVAKLRK